MHPVTYILKIYVAECICSLCLCCCALCVALSVFFCALTSFDLLRMCYVLWLRRHYKSEWERAREKARGNNNDLSHVPSKRKEEIKPGTSGCGSFVVPYFQPATSIDRLHIVINGMFTSCRINRITSGRSNSVISKILLIIYVDPFSSQIYKITRIFEEQLLFSVLPWLKN